MIKKKITKDPVKKISIFPSKKDYPFMGLLVLFTGFSLFAIFSFFNSTNDYLNRMYTSVIDDGNFVQPEGVSDIEPACYTCPEPRAEYQVCAILWDVDICPLDKKAVRQIFTDVDSNHVNFEAIDDLYAAGIIKGYNDGSFKPEKTINRAELLSVLTTAVDADFAGRVLENCFTDVKNEWFAAFVCYAKEEGWVEGYADGSFKPGQVVSRAEALKITFKAFNYKTCDVVNEKPYNDVAIDAWYAPYVCAAKNNKIIDELGVFRPDDGMTRGEIVQIIYNIMKDLKLL